MAKPGLKVSRSTCSESSESEHESSPKDNTLSKEPTHKYLFDLLCVMEMDPWSALSWTIETNKPDHLRLRLEANKDPIDLETVYTNGAQLGCEVLCEAVKKGDPECVQVLLDVGAERFIDIPNK